MHCIKGRTICRMLCNFWFGMLGGLVVYSFTFLLDLAWFNLIDYFPCIWLLSLQIESHQEWVWYFLLDHLTILHYLTCTDGVRVANVLSPVFLMCACRIYLFSHSFVKTFHLVTSFQKAYGEIHICYGMYGKSRESENFSSISGRPIFIFLICNLKYGRF